MQCPARNGSSWQSLAWRLEPNPSKPARWTDSTGKYSIEATLVTFNDKLVVLKRKTTSWPPMPLDKLSKADQDYVQSQEAQDWLE